MVMVVLLVIFVDDSYSRNQMLNGIEDTTIRANPVLLAEEIGSF